MTARESPPLSLGAVLLNGLPTVIFPTKPYRRVVRTVDMVNTVGSGVTIYRGTVGAFTRVSSHPQGSQQTYTVPFTLPSGQGLFVQWTAGTAASARATITWMEEGVSR
jgi:hypothetical protein